VKGDNIGAPIPKMVDRVKSWLKEGKDVRIFTARASHPDSGTIPAIHKWCQKHIGRILLVTDRKDQFMTALYDDRAYHVEHDTGDTANDTDND